MDRSFQNEIADQRDALRSALGLLIRESSAAAVNRTIAELQRRAASPDNAGQIGDRMTRAIEELIDCQETVR